MFLARGYDEQFSCPVLLWSQRKLAMEEDTMSALDEGLCVLRI